MKAIKFDEIRLGVLAIFRRIEVDGDKGVIYVNDEDYDLWKAIRAIEEGGM